MPDNPANEPKNLRSNFSDDEVFEMELIAQNEGKSIYHQMLERSGGSTGVKLYDQQGVDEKVMEAASPKEGFDSKDLDSTSLPKLVETQRSARKRREEARNEAEENQPAEEGEHTHSE